ncbi:MAG: monovalent cation/H(+) antiporter subunit G, partial [Proteobacteria bacterium]|nr:monovalent cation/H(+) antiporter subunit G [Pseudomonadota bacterium]
FRAKNTLQILHFCTIIDIICIPLALITTLFALNTEHTRVLYAISIVMILSPVSSYFIGKLYYRIPKETA